MADTLTAAPPETLALQTGGLPAAAPGSDENVFTFWPRHNAAIYQALADRHTQVETAGASTGETRAASWFRGIPAA